MSQPPKPTQRLPRPLALALAGGEHEPGDMKT